MITVEWTGVAREDYLAILKETYEQSVDAALQLDDKIEGLLTNLRRFKHFCPPSRNFPKFRRCVVTRYISLVYETGENFITIISVFDSRGRSLFV